MVKEFLFILLGIVIGTATPHFANMVNSVLVGDWGGVVDVLSLAWRSWVIEAVVALIIICVLHKIDKKREREENAKTDKIVQAINELGITLGNKIDTLGVKIDGKSISDKPK